MGKRVKKPVESETKSLLVKNAPNAKVRRSAVRLQKCNVAISPSALKAVATVVPTIRKCKVNVKRCNGSKNETVPRKTQALKRVVGLSDENPADGASEAVRASTEVTPERKRSRTEELRPNKFSRLSLSHHKTAASRLAETARQSQGESQQEQSVARKEVIEGRPVRLKATEVSQEVPKIAFRRMSTRRNNLVPLEKETNEKVPRKTRAVTATQKGQSVSFPQGRDKLQSVLVVETLPGQISQRRETIMSTIQEESDKGGRSATPGRGSVPVLKTTASSESEDVQAAKDANGTSIQALANEKVPRKTRAVTATQKDQSSSLLQGRDKLQSVVVEKTLPGRISQRRKTTTSRVQKAPTSFQSLANEKIPRKTRAVKSTQKDQSESFPQKLQGIVVEKTLPGRISQRRKTTSIIQEAPEEGGENASFDSEDIQAAKDVNETKRSFHSPDKFSRLSIRRPANSLSPKEIVEEINKDEIPKQTKAKRPKRSAVKLAQIVSKKQKVGSVQLKSKRKPKKSTSPDLFPDDIEHNDIYAFPSQLSMSESDDVTSAVIEKLVQQGKVQYAKNPKPKNRKKNAVKAANWHNIVKNLDAKKPRKKVAKKTIQIDAPQYNNDDDGDDHFDIALNSTDHELQLPPQTFASNFMPKSNHSFSKLAQKVMTKRTAQAANTSTPVARSSKLDTSKLHLLEIAKNFAQSIPQSTPNKTLGTSRFQSPNGNASPWRADTEDMPRTFYFSRSKDDLPSYSSDVFPSSQPSNNASLNISNIENITPEKSVFEKPHRLPLGNVNPRHGIRERSPLKAINVLDVVTLPYRVNVKSIKSPARTIIENSRTKLDKSVSNRSIFQTSVQAADKENSISAANSTVDTNSMHNHFGFNDSDQSDDGESPKKAVNLPSRKSLRANLKKLKRLLPPKPTRISCERIRTVFKPIEKQTDIREILSSTMVGTNAKKMPSDDQTGRIEFDDNSIDPIPTEEIAGDVNASSPDLHLFDDIDEPQTSFDVSVKIKTYERHTKRKETRKRKNFILFSHDSDEEKQEAQDVRRKKRPKEDKIRKKELKTFVREFNSMCLEVEQYDLVVENDKSKKDSSE